MAGRAEGKEIPPALSSSSLPTTFSFGWMFLNLNFSNGGLIQFDPLMQNWVSVVMDADGRFSVGFDAIQLGNVTNGDVTNNPVIIVQ